MGDRARSWYSLVCTIKTFIALCLTSSLDFNCARRVASATESASSAVHKIRAHPWMQVMIIRKRDRWQEGNVRFILDLLDRRASVLAVPFFLSITTLSSTVNEVTHPHCWWGLLTTVVDRLSRRRVRSSALVIIVTVVTRHAATLTLGFALIIDSIAPIPITPFALDAESAVTAPLVFFIRARI
jgi:hypothetical protein